MFGYGPTNYCAPFLVFNFCLISPVDLIVQGAI
jgi:hypothetical protein